MSVSDTIRLALSQALAEAGITVAPHEVPLEFPAELSHGDYATGVALAKAKDAGMNPRALAEKIVTALGAVEVVAKIEIAGPGFINFTLAPSTLADSVEAIRAGKNREATPPGKRLVLMEYTSPNLFKPLHVGNLVGNIIGESLARLMEYSGADVKRINYPSDIGLTVAKGVWGLLNAKGILRDPGRIMSLGKAYVAGNEAYESDLVAKKEIEDINSSLYRILEDGPKTTEDSVLASLREGAILTSLQHLDDICARLGTTFDLEIFESQAAPTGLKIALDHPEIFPLSEGARIFNGSHTRVFVNSKGLPTYEAKDLGNFVLKQKHFPKWDSYIVVTGSEQKEYFAVLYQAIKVLFPETKERELRHISTGFLTLTTGKMSSRRGNVLTGESLLEDLEESAKERAQESRADDKDALAKQVAVAAIKYEVLKSGTGRNIVFDKERALSLEGDSGPYLQYAHARCNAILAKSAEQGIAAECRTSDVLHGLEVARLVHRFPEVVASAVREMEPHVVATYLIQLAGAFNSWYAQEQILDGTPAAAHKVALTDAVRATLKKGLWLLGIPAPERM